MKKEVKEIRESILAQLGTMDEKDLIKVLDFLARIATEKEQKQKKEEREVD